jgi:hypothetical protein
MSYNKVLYYIIVVLYEEKSENKVPYFIATK